jgi:RNA polymerase sigma-70 factor (ECF subfamily)
MVHPDTADRTALRERERHDARLVARIAAGDAQALGVLYDTYGAVVYGLAVAITQCPERAQVAVTHAFGDVWRDAGAFDASVRSVFAWLSSLVRTRALAERKPGDPRRPLLPGLGAATPVAEALSQLSTLERRAIELAYFQGLTRREIAAVLGDTEVNVGLYLRSGMEALRASLAAPAPRLVAES